MEWNRKAGKGSQISSHTIIRNLVYVAWHLGMRENNRGNYLGKYLRSIGPPKLSNATSATADNIFGFSIKIGVHYGGCHQWRASCTAESHGRTRRTEGVQ